jgi:hypothetical protein
VLEPSFDLHFFVNRDGQLCVSTTLSDGRKTRAVASRKLYEDAQAIRGYLLEREKGWPR